MASNTKTFQPIGGSRPFSSLTVPADAIERPAYPQTPYGTDLSKDRNGVFIRIGDRVRDHSRHQITFIVVGVFCDKVIALGDSTNTTVEDAAIDIGGYLDVFESILCADCEIVGHVEHFAAELKRIERESAELQRRSKAGRL